MGQETIPLSPGGSVSTPDQTPLTFGTRVQRAIVRKLADLWRDLWLAIVLILVGVLLYIGMSLYQSWLSAYDSDFQHCQEILAEDSGIGLRIAYPRTLWRDSRAEGQVVTISAWCTAALTCTRPYTIGFTTPMTVVALTDMEGNPASSWFVITPTVGVGPSLASHSFRIRQRLLAEDGLPSFTPVLHIQSTWGSEAYDLEPIDLQSRWQALGRHFWSLICGPATPLLTVIAGLVTLAVQLATQAVHRWREKEIEAEKEARQKQAEAEERARQQRAKEEMEKERHQREVEAARAVIRAWESLLRSNMSEGARRYLDYRGSEGVWQDKEVRAYLQEVWEKNAGAELRLAVELLSCPDDKLDDAILHFGSDESAKALKWAYDHLDDEWRQRIPERAVRLGQSGADIVREMNNMLWNAILRPWTGISLWRNLPPTIEPGVAEGLDILGLENNPFGPECAEKDTLLLASRVDPPGWEDLSKPQPVFAIGEAGSGKTAAALLIAYDALYGPTRDVFPVYYPVAGTPDLWGVARALAQTLLCYLALMPDAFLRCPVSGRTAMSHVMVLCVPPDLASQFHLAGLPSTGKGKEVLSQIEELAQGRTFQQSLNDDDLVTLLGDARPHGFRFTTLLTDMQGTGGASLEAETLIGLSERLAQVGVFIKAFLPDSFRAHLESRGLLFVTLRWEDDLLHKLLEARLKSVGAQVAYDPRAGEKASLLGTWCDLREGDLSLDSRLIQAAHGTPRGLFDKGNALLRRIGERGRPLRRADLRYLGRSRERIGRNAEARAARHGGSGQPACRG